MANIIIRKADRESVRDYLKVSASLHKLMMTEYLSAGFECKLSRADVLSPEQYLGRDFYMIELSSHPEDYVGVYECFADDEMCKLDSIYIEERHRGEGYAGMIINRLGSKYEKVVVDVRKTNKNAVQFYQYKGFATTYEALS
ncbi:MAG: GNAT family N-acetyltransferase, partial [Cetobacterium sp.]